MSSMRNIGIGVAAFALLGIGLYVGVAIEMSREPTTGHSATEEVSVNALGDPAAGRELFVTKSCAMCHQFQGRGGTDAPALDSMMGGLGAMDMAGMSGDIWNHLPAMEKAFKEEGIKFPTFAPGEMEDLIAYLHGGGPPPDMGMAREMGMEEGGMEGSK